MGSNPTPRASNVGSTKSTKRNKNKQQDHVPGITNKKDMTLRKSQIQINHSSSYSSSADNIEEIETKIDSITKSLSKPYFNKILKELSKTNFENVNIICDYIIAEQIEFNIKDMLYFIKEFY